ncbi:MAG: DUF4142 domain-containing protein [Gemmatimonadaceae bacterium]
MSRVLRRTPLVLACAASLVACEKPDAAGNGTRVVDSTGAAASSSPATVPAAPVLTDANIMAMLDQAHAADSATGAIAAARGANEDVNVFGRRMMRDHHALRVGGEAIATSGNISPVLRAGDDAGARVAALGDSLTVMPRGAAWDRFYLDEAVMHHEQALATAQAGAAAAQNPELKAMIAKVAAILQRHLDRAKLLRANMG